MAAFRVLHVEDDPLQQRILVHHLSALADLAFQVTCAPSEQAALEAFQRDRPDLVVLDYQLEQGNGLHLLESLRRLDPVVPIIAISGVASGDIAAQLVQAGADDFIEKGRLTSQNLGQSVRTALRRAETVRQRGAVAASALDARLRDLCREHATRTGLELLPALDRFEAWARQEAVSAQQLAEAFARVDAALSSERAFGDVPAGKLVRPLLLEIATRLFGKPGAD